MDSNKFKMIKKGDFIELDYVGKIESTNQIFDLTYKELAKQHNIFNPKFKYGPIIICVGEGDILKSLDEKLIGKKPGKYTIQLKKEEAFGDRDFKLIKTVSTQTFTKQKINPFPGLQVQLGDGVGVIRSVSGGRTIVDFNYPLAGKNLVYDLDIRRIIENDEEKLNAFTKLHFNVSSELKDNKARINVKIPKEIQEQITSKLQKLIPSIKSIDYN